jgi:pimeloyl-ACP methyl ester carboxylesterase
MPAVERTDTWIENDEALRLFVREVRPLEVNAAMGPVLLVHGARVPGVPSFDLPVDGGSLAVDLGVAGHLVYVLDIRGYGRSTRPPEMNAPPVHDRTLVRANEAARDIAAVVEWIRVRCDCAQVALLGWATGGMWCGYYAAQWPERVSALILYNSLYQSPAHPTLGAGSTLEDATRSGRFNLAEIGSYRFNQGAGLLATWDASIPVDDTETWRDPEVAAAYVREALASDCTSTKRDPPSFRAPSGALEDSFYQACGRQLWDASLIQARALVIAGERDFWSQPIDRERLMAHLVHARDAQLKVIPEATHFVHLDRAEVGRSTFLSAVTDFLADA